MSFPPVLTILSAFILNSNFNGFPLISQNFAEIYSIHYMNLPLRGPGGLISTTPPARHKSCYWPGGSQQNLDCPTHHQRSPHFSSQGDNASLWHCWSNPVFLCQKSMTYPHSGSDRIAHSCSSSLRKQNLHPLKLQFDHGPQGFA